MIPESEMTDHLRWAYYNDPYVHHMIRSNLEKDEIIAALVRRHLRSMEEISALQAIVPKKFQMRDGSQQVWNCTHDLIPVIKL